MVASGGESWRVVGVVVRERKWKMLKIVVDGGEGWKGGRENGSGGEW